MQALKIVDFTPQQAWPNEKKFAKRLKDLIKYADMVDECGAAIGKPYLASEFATAISCFIACVNEDGCREMVERMFRT